MAAQEPKMRAFKQMDVFTSVPYSGNPLAVVIDGQGLTTESMQKFATWTNLSETTFILPPTTPKAHYKVRIFTTARELPFAGHPTLGTCRAWLDSQSPSSRQELLSKGHNQIIQECGIGLVQISLDPSTDRLSFSAPPFLRQGEVSEPILKRACSTLGLERKQVLASNWIDNGPGWFCLVLESAELVKSLKFEPAKCAGEGEDQDKENGFFGVVGPYHEAKKLFAEKGLISGSGSSESNKDDFESPHFEIRAFVIEENMEDPVTGSFNAGVARYLIASGLAPERYVASQGANLGRAGKIYVNRVTEKDENGSEVIWIGGDVVTCIEGKALI